MAPILVVGFSLFSLSNCTSTQAPPPISSTTQSEYEADYEDDEENTKGEDEDEESESTDKWGAAFKVDEEGFKHPRKANAFETKRLVMIVTDRPSDSDLGVCAADLAAMGQSSLNGDSLLQSKSLLAAAAAKNPKFYHWCFYRLMSSLDVQLNGQKETKQYQERYKSFLSTMKTLWILARALDQQRNVKTYFTYLRSRYLELSQFHFARKLEVITEPLGEKRPGIDLTPGKPAAKFAH